MATKVDWIIEDIGKACSKINATGCANSLEAMLLGKAKADLLTALASVKAIREIIIGETDTKLEEAINEL